MGEPIRSKIVCLVGSVGQEADWRFYAQALTKRGYVVFEAGSYDKTATPETWNVVTGVHRQKMEMSDIIAVIRKPDKLVGKHTQFDIDYAKFLNKEIVDVETIA